MEVYIREGFLEESSSSLGSKLAFSWALDDLEQDISLHCKHKHEGLLIGKIIDDKRLC